MIDIEYQLFDIVAKGLREKFPGVLVVGSSIQTFPTYPAVEIVEIGNAVYRKSRDIALRENHAVIAYQVRITTSGTRLLKLEAKQIAQETDRLFSERGFLRIAMSPVQLETGSAYQLILRYRGVVAKTNTVF